MLRISPGKKAGEIVLQSISRSARFTERLGSWGREEYRIAKPIANPSASAPSTVGTGFSRRKNSVRSRTTTAFWRV